MWTPCSSWATRTSVAAQFQTIAYTGLKYISVALYHGLGA